MQLKALGTSGGIGQHNQTTAFILDDDTLIDCGTGILSLELEQLKRIRRVILTHAHMDHCATLPLLVDVLYETLVDNPLEIITTQPTMRALKNHIFNWEMWPDFFALPDADNPVLTFREVNIGDTLEVDDRSFEFIEVNHSVPAFALKISSAGGKDLVFSGDTTSCERFWQTLNAMPNIDILIMECAYPAAMFDMSVKAKHYCATTLVHDIKILKHSPELFITHLKPGEEQQIMSELKDMMPERKPKQLHPAHVFEL